MKNKKIILAVLAAALVLGMTACDTGSSGGTSGGSARLATATYKSLDNDGNVYELVITEAGGRAAYSPKNGDTYVLTIYSPDGKIKGKSSGAVEVNGLTLTLTKDGNSFTVTVTADAQQISGITAELGIPLDTGGKLEQPTIIATIPDIAIDSNMGGWNFGWEADGKTVSYNQIWWEISSTKLVEKAKAPGAKVVLVFEYPLNIWTGFVWQAPDDPVWRWWEHTEIINQANKDTFAAPITLSSDRKTLTVPLSSVVNYDILKSETKLRFLIICHEVGSIVHFPGIASANLVE